MADRPDHWPGDWRRLTHRAIVTLVYNGPASIHPLTVRKGKHELGRGRDYSLMRPDPEVLGVFENFQGHFVVAGEWWTSERTERLHAARAVQRLREVMCFEKSRPVWMMAKNVC